MSESKFTPGPWVVWKPSVSTHYYYRGIKAADGSIIINKGTYEPHGIYGSGKDGSDREECYANADLIAAAPEMLEALEEAFEVLGPYWCTPDGDCNNEEVIDLSDKIKLLIAKAKGE